MTNLLKSLNSDYLKDTDIKILKLLLSKNNKLIEDNNSLQNMNTKLQTNIIELQTKITKLEEELKNAKKLTQNEILTIIFQNCKYAMITDKYDKHIMFDVNRLNEFIKDNTFDMITPTKGIDLVHITNLSFKNPNPDWYVNMSKQ